MQGRAVSIGRGAARSSRDLRGLSERPPPSTTRSAWEGCRPVEPGLTRSLSVRRGLPHPQRAREPIRAGGGRPASRGVPRQRERGEEPHLAVLLCDKETWRACRGCERDELLGPFHRGGSLGGSPSFFREPAPHPRVSLCPQALATSTRGNHGVVCGEPRRPLNVSHAAPGCA